jgi:uncharacterized protein involved in exopolysaccharide biosynthesis
MEVWDWWPFIIRRSKTIITVTILTVVVTMAVTFVMPATYRSGAILYMQPLSQEQVLSYPSATQLGARNAGELIKSVEVGRRAAEKLGKNKLEGVPDIRVPENTGLVEVLVDAQSPQMAADEANAIAAAFIEFNADTVRMNVVAAQASIEAQLKTLRGQIVEKEAELATARSQPGGEDEVSGIQDELETLKTGYEGVLSRWQALPSAETLLVTSISLADKALPDTEPVAPRPILNLMLALVGGLLFGMAVARMTEGSGERRSGV